MIVINPSELRRAQVLLSHIPKGAEKACARALNRAARGVITDTARDIAKDYVIKQADMKRSMDLEQRATTSDLKAKIKLIGRRIPLIKFKVLPKSFQRGKRKKHIFAQVKRSGGKVLPNNYFVNIKRASREPAVLKRTTKKRYPLHEVFGPAIPQMVGTAVNARRLERKAQDRLSTTLTHEINRLLNGHGG